jgi:hypothetical protein
MRFRRPLQRAARAGRQFGAILGLDALNRPGADAEAGGDLLYALVALR